MNISIRKISSKEAFNRTIDFLTKDVMINGGSAGEVIDVHGIVLIITICRIPIDWTGKQYSTVVINEETDRLGAMAWLFQTIT